MDIREIDCESYATRVAYGAAYELHYLLSGDTDDQKKKRESFVPGSPDRDLEEELQRMGEYVCRKGCETGERLFRWLCGIQKQEFAWEDVPPEMALTFETFVSVCSNTFLKLRCLQIEAENQEKRPAPVQKVDIEDTIFEKVGSLGEMLPHAVEASRMMAEHAAVTKQAAEEASGGDNKALSLGDTVHSGGQAPETSEAGDQQNTAQTAGDGGETPDLPPAPKTPAQRKNAPKETKNTK